MKNIPEISILALICFFVLSCKQEASGPETSGKTSAQQQTGSVSSPQTNAHSTTENRQTSLSEFSRSDLISSLENLSPEQLAEQADRIRQLMLENPEEASAILESYFRLLAEHAPDKAIDFSIDHASYTQDPAAAYALISETFKDWKEQNTQSLELYLHSLFNLQEGYEHRSNEIISLLITPDADQNFKSEQWLDWVGALSSEHENSTVFQGAALNTILKHSDLTDPELFAKIEQAYTQRLTDPAMQKYLSDYSSQIAHLYPAKTRALLDQIPSGSYREKILEQVMGDLGREHPEVAAEWLASPNILDEIFRPLTQDITEDAKAHGATTAQLEDALTAYRAEANATFDRSLKAYIFSLVHTHPEDAMENVDSIISPEHREVVRKDIQAIVDTFEKNDE